MNNRVGISQSNYVPWLGFFELVSKCDSFVFLESVQYTKNDWRNRNLIRINDRPHWLTIPVSTGNSLSITLKDVEVADPRWLEKHLSTIKHAYSGHGSKSNLGDFLAEIYPAELKSMEKLSDINIFILNRIFSLLEIKIDTFTWTSSDSLTKQERVLGICKEFGAKNYLTTLKGKSYLDEHHFNRNDINIEVFTHERVNQYTYETQKHFQNNFSIIDSVANRGLQQIKDYLKSE
jgi:hypothetical protein